MNKRTRDRLEWAIHEVRDLCDKVWDIRLAIEDAIGGDFGVERPHVGDVYCHGCQLSFGGLDGIEGTCAANGRSVERFLGCPETRPAWCPIRLVVRCNKGAA